MYDIKLVRRAKLYSDAMAQGINPLNGDYVNEHDSLSQEKIQNCMVFISQILDSVISSGGSVKKNKSVFSITPEQKARIELSDEPVGVNELARRINAVVDSNSMRTVSGTKIASWMVKNGYLDLVTIDDNKTIKTVNEKSSAFGILERDKVNLDTGDTYKQPVYNKAAQQYIVGHIEEINR
ncbi:MAG: hypothetical protein HFE49_00275 [Clostridia bacterium]|nr:hypothetical protein [Clostridia bacterium]